MRVILSPQTAEETTPTPANLRYQARPAAILIGAGRRVASAVPGPALAGRITGAQTTRAPHVRAYLLMLLWRHAWIRDRDRRGRTRPLLRLSLRVRSGCLATHLRLLTVRRDSSEIGRVGLFGRGRGRLSREHRLRHVLCQTPRLFLWVDEFAAFQIERIPPRLDSGRHPCWRFHELDLGFVRWGDSIVRPGEEHPVRLLPVGAQHLDAPATAIRIGKPEQVGSGRQRDTGQLKGPAEGEERPLVSGLRRTAR